MNICVVGTGYVGLVVGTCLSDFGMNVICVDKDKSKIEMLQKGKIPIYERGLSELIERNIKLERLSFSSDLKSAVDRSLVIFVGVGTPVADDGSVDMTAINDVVEDIAKAMNDYKVIVMKSTVPVGTAKAMKKSIRENLTSKIDFDIVSNPEFLREGTAVDDFLRPDRVIIGSDSEKALAIVRDIYRPLYLMETPIISTTHETAELIKYAANTMLAVRISFINEIANLCDKIGADIYQVATAIGMDKRIGSSFLHPGPGYGGSCLPKDVTSLVQYCKDNDFDFKIAQAVLDVNIRQKELVVKKTSDLLGGLKDKNICLLGLAFKPDTDDVREAPALYVAQEFSKAGAVVNAYDPVAMDEFRKNFSDGNFFNNAYDACKDADVILIMTEWNEFRDLDFNKMKDKVRKANIYDTRNIYQPAAVREAGFTYICTGRP